MLGLPVSHDLPEVRAPRGDPDTHGGQDAQRRLEPALARLLPLFEGDLPGLGIAIQEFVHLAQVVPDVIVQCLDPHGPQEALVDLLVHRVRPDPGEGVVQGEVECAPAQGADFVQEVAEWSVLYDKEVAEPG